MIYLDNSGPPPTPPGGSTTRSCVRFTSWPHRLVRCSLGYANTEQEIDRLLVALERIAGYFQSPSILREIGIRTCSGLKR